MRTDLLWRSAVPVAAMVALAAGAPRAVTGLLVLLGLALATERLVRLRGLGLADGVLVGVGGVIAVVILTGMLLGSTPVGITPGSWTVSLSVLALAGLGGAEMLTHRSSSDPTSRPASGTAPGAAPVGGAALRVLPWVAVAVAVVAVSVQMSATSLSAFDAEPVEMSFGSVTDTEVEVVVSSSEAVGPLEVRTSDGTSEISYPLLDLAEGGSTTQTVSVPETGRFVISLTNPDQTEPLRTLVLDR